MSHIARAAAFVAALDKAPGRNLFPSKGGQQRKGEN
jgi:hypothetical protein